MMMKKLQWIYLLMAATASLTMGCGFRQYEKVEVPVQTQAKAAKSEKQGENVTNTAAGVGNAADDESESNVKLVPEDETKDETVSIVIEAGADQKSADSGPSVEQEHGEDTADSESSGENSAQADAVKNPEHDSGGGQTNGNGVTMLFGGDVYLSDHVLNAYNKAGGISGVLDSAYRQEIADADIFFVNEEFPFSDRGTQAADKQYTFRLPPEKVSIFQDIGIDGVTLANNHALDFGTDALLDSCVALDSAGIGHTGAGANLDAAKQAVTYEVNGRKIAIVGASRVFPQTDWAAGASHPGMLSAYDPAVLLEQIRTLRQNQDIVIAYIHWGIEREETPNDIQKNLARQLIDAGADLVIGAHPHVLQGIEYYKGKPIIYSLGNFIFGSSIPRTALLKVTFEPATDGQSGEQTAVSAPHLTLIPGTSASGYTHTLESESQKKEFINYMQSISFNVNIDENGDVFEN
jgi:poly-gamma-glutamate synthesis protein (capsule biosynthesis protein)